MSTLMTLVSTNQKSIAPSKENATKDAESDAKNISDDFITILFSQIKNSAKTTSKDDVLSLSANNNTKKNDKAKSSDEILLDEILNIVNQLKTDGTDTKKFPNFSDKMDKILNNESTKNDFKNVKNLDDVLKLSKKYNLGLKDIELTKDSVDNLKKDFPKLDIENFFTTKTDKIPNKLKSETIVKANNNKENFINKISQNSSNIKSDDSPKNMLQNFLKNLDTKETHTENNKIISSDTQKTDAKQNKNTSLNTQNSSKLTDDIKKEIVSSNDKNTNINIKNSDIKDTKSTIYANQNSIQPVKDTKKEAISKSDKKAKPDITSLEDRKNLTVETKPKDRKKSTIDEARVEKNQTKQNTQDQILHKIKAQKHTNSSYLNNNQNNISNTTADSDLQTKSEEIKTESKSNKFEFKNTIQTDDSKTVKNSETKNTLNNFSNDLKEKIENYKPPLMKIKMALNPKNLGEVEVTLINRGNNLHVNIVSNTNTMSLFTQNQAEFKNSLVNMGFTNLEMNFSDQGQNSQQNQQNSKKQSNSFEEFNQQEDHESSLELVVPRYI